MPDAASRPQATPPRVGRVRLTDRRTIHELPADGPYRTARVPDLAVVDARTILAVWRCEVIGAGFEKGDILIARSEDAGDTWSGAGVLARHDAERFYGGAQLHVHDGAVYAFLGFVPAAAPDAEPMRLAALRSADAGRSWTPLPFRVDYPFPTIANTKILRSGPRFLMGFHRNDRDGGDGELVRLHGVLASTDLESWTLAGLIPNPDGAFLQEGWLHPLPGEGAVGILMRTDRGVAFSSESRDGGRTWSPARPEPDLPNNNTKPVLVPDRTGRLVYLFNTNAAFGVDAAPNYTTSRAILNAKVREPGGAWGPGLVVADEPAWNTYPSAEEVAPGRFCLVWENSDRRVLFGRTDWLPDMEPPRDEPCPPS